MYLNVRWTILLKTVRIEISNKEKLNVFDGFTGSTVVARALSSVVSKLHVNDIELYSYLMSKCYLEIPSNEHQEVIKNHIDIIKVLYKINRLDILY